MLSILIGSGALQHHGYLEEPNDYDLIVDKALGDQLSIECDKKIDRMYWFGNKKIDIKIIDSGDNNTDAKLFELCNRGYNDGIVFVDKITICDTIEVLVPPLELLYAIKKSHIHRILPLTGLQENDIQIWKKHMKMYNWARQQLNYKRMDWVIYGDKERYAEPQPVNDTYESHGKEPKIAYLTRKLFLDRFNETNERVGDTKITLQEGKEEFFDDNVERFIDHDELHAKVAMACRDTPEPLFKKYQENKDNVSMDKVSFLKAPVDEQHQIIREEIMVLLLERKWIPELVNCYKKPSIPYVGYIKEKKLEELDEIIAHFITNLCGQGHYWLRRFCLDHYEIYSHLELYDLGMLEKIALQVVDINCADILETFGQVLTGIDKYDGYHDQHLNKIYDQIKAHSLSSDKKGHYILSKHCQEHLSGCQCIEEVTDYTMDITRIVLNDDYEDVEYSNNSLDITLISTTGDINDKYLGQCLFEFRNGIISRYIIDILNKFNQEYTLFYCHKENLILYDLKNNLGLTLDMNQCQWKLFTIHMYMNEVIVKQYFSDKKKKNFQISGSVIDLGTNEAMVDLGTNEEKQDFNENYSKRCMVYYYYSDDCDWGDKHETDRIPYLSSYGNMPVYLTSLFEYIAKNNLGINEEYEDEYYSHGGNCSDEECYD